MDDRWKEHFPERTALLQLPFTWVVAQARLGSRGVRKIIPDPKWATDSEGCMPSCSLSGSSHPSWQSRHKANIVLSQTSHHRKKGDSITRPRVSRSLRCCPAAFASSLGLGTLISLSVLSRKKSQHNIKCTVFWLWVGRCPLIYLPELRENISESFLNENLRETEGNLNFSWFILLEFWCFTGNTHSFVTRTKKTEGLEGMNLLHSLRIKSLLQMSLKILNIMREFYWVLREVVQFNWGFPVLSGAENKGLYCGLPAPVFPFPRA